MVSSGVYRGCRTGWAAASGACSAAGAGDGGLGPRAGCTSGPRLLALRPLGLRHLSTALTYNLISRMQHFVYKLPSNRMPLENLVTLFSPELIRHIASFMHPNYVATGFKLTCKDVAQAVREQFTTIHLRGEPRALQSFRFGSIIIALAEQPWPGAAFVAHWGRPEPWRPLNRRDRHRLLCLAASSHHAPSLDAALAHCGTVIQADALASAITAGDLAACRRLHETEGYDMEPELAAAAAGVAGSLPVCKWLVETATSAIFTILPELCYARHSDAVELALRQADVSQRPGCRRRLLGAAAAAGRVELLRQLATRFPLSLKDEDGRPTVLSHVASGCPLEVLQQYYEPWGSRLLWTAGQKRQLLMAAAASPTPDWAAKCEWLWAQWGGAAAGLGAGLGHVEGIDQRVSNIMRRPDFPQRLQLLASYGLGCLVEGKAPWEAGVVGSTAAVEFCLDQLPALLRQQAVPAAGGGLAAAAGVPAPQQQPPLQWRLVVPPLIPIAAVAFERGHVPVLRLLRERGHVFPAPRDLAAVLAVSCRNVRSRNEDLARTNMLRSLRYLLLEEPGAVQQGGVDKDWSSLFQNAARSGADLPLLQHLHEQVCGMCEFVGHVGCADTSGHCCHISY